MASLISCLRNRAHCSWLYRIFESSNSVKSNSTNLSVTTVKKPSPGPVFTNHSPEYSLSF